MNSDPVPQHLIEEARQKGLVPGATVKCVRTADEIVLPPYSEWQYRISFYAPIIRIRSNGTTIHLYDADFRTDRTNVVRWATVITPAPSQGLQEGDAVKCTPAMRAAIVERAKELNLAHHFIEYEGFPYLAMSYASGGKTMAGVSANPSRAYNWLSAPEFLRRLEQTKKPVPVIKIYGQEVKFSAEGISFGSRKVDRATVLGVADRLTGKTKGPDLSSFKGKKALFPTMAMRAAAIERMASRGIPCRWDTSIHEDAMVLFVREDDGNVDAQRHGATISYCEFLATIEAITPGGPHFSACAHPISFTDTGITVGCQSIPKQTVLDIAERLREIA